MFKTWLVFLYTSFVVSVLTMTFVQIRAMQNAGSWRSLRGRPFFQTYWRELSMTQRVLLWTGITAFVITLVVAQVAAIFHR